jgi:hypothetical protein
VVNPGKKPVAPVKDGYAVLSELILSAQRGKNGLWICNIKG